MKSPLPVRIVASAGKAILDAAEWRVANRPKAPDAFTVELECAIQILASQPLIGARARNIKLSGVRRLHPPPQEATAARPPQWSATEDG